MEDCRIIITRESALYGCALKHTVELDGLTVGVLENGSSLSIDTTAGTHTLSFIAHGKIEKSIPITIASGLSPVTLLARLNGRQKIEITKAPVIGDAPVGSKFVKCRSCGVDIPKSAKTCPHCGAKNKRHKALGIFLVIIGVAILIGAFGGNSNSEPNKDSTPAMNASGESQGVDEREQAAQKLLDAAADDFSSGMYSSAFSKCDKVKSDYSDTAVAASVDAFLSGLYDTAVNITAVDLHSAYDANEVNADNTYKGKAIVVTGTVSDIGKNVLNQTYITLKDGSDYGLTSVQCFFESEQEDTVGSISKGNSVKLIGKCTGENLMNVQLSNCYLIG